MYLVYSVYRKVLRSAISNSSLLLKYQKFQYLKISKIVSIKTFSLLLNQDNPCSVYLEGVTKVKHPGNLVAKKNKNEFEKLLEIN